MHSMLTLQWISYYHSGRFGAEDKNVPPYALFESAIEEADSILNWCEEFKKGNYTEIPEF